jgi:putative acetyltransferase
MNPPASRQSSPAVSDAPFVIRAAQPDDADGLAAVHMESIRALGAGFYAPDIVSDWGQPRTGERYRAAMAEGERFFLAMEDATRILGFSSYRKKDGKHRTAIYVAGQAARRGVGSALFGAAEAAARHDGATELHVDASLAAVSFYLANGFIERARGQHRLRSGRLMDCVFMRKPLT